MRPWVMRFQKSNSSVVTHQLLKSQRRFASALVDEGSCRRSLLSQMPVPRRWRNHYGGSNEPAPRVLGSQGDLLSHSFPLNPLNRGEHKKYLSCHHLVGRFFQCEKNSSTQKNWKMKTMVGTYYIFHLVCVCVFFFGEGNKNTTRPRVSEGPVEQLLCGFPFWEQLCQKVGRFEPIVIYGVTWGPLWMALQPKTVLTVGKNWSSKATI